MPVPLLVAFSFKNWLQVLFWDVREIKGDFSETDRSLDICSCHAHTPFLVNGGAPLKRETKRKKERLRDICLFHEICILREIIMPMDSVTRLLNQEHLWIISGEKKENLLKVVIREKEMSEERERTLTWTVLTKPPPSQVADPDVTLAWDTEPNPPFQTLGDTVYSVSHSNFLFIVS